MTTDNASIVAVPLVRIATMRLPKATTKNDVLVTPNRTHFLGYFLSKENMQGKKKAQNTVSTSPIPHDNGAALR